MSENMPKRYTNQPVTIIGRQVRTNNARSIGDIPALWGAVMQNDLLEPIPGKLSGDLYAVYANLENAGRSNEGYFSFIIGSPVAAETPVPDGMVLVSVPSSDRMRFPAPDNDPTRIVEAWQQAWAYDDSEKTYVCEYELYSQSGEVSVNLGVR